MRSAATLFLMYAFAAGLAGPAGAVTLARQVIGGGGGHLTGISGGARVTAGQAVIARAHAGGTPGSTTAHAGFWPRGAGGVTVGIETPEVFRFALKQNTPNPFYPATSIRFSLAEAGHVTIDVFDVRGRVVAVLANGAFEAGWQEISYRPRSLASGVYFYRISAGAFTETRRMTLVH